MTISVHRFVMKWGYWGLFGASLIESEPVVICISFLSGLTSFKLIFIFLLTVLGTFIGSTLFFIFGRFFRSWVKRFSFIDSNTPRINDLINKYGVYFIIGFRFIYGIKLISPIILGFSNIRWLAFLIYNFIGSLLWSFLIVSAGFFMRFFVKDFNLMLVFYVYVLTIMIPFVFILIYKYFNSFFIKK